MTELEKLQEQYKQLNAEAGKYNHPEFDEVYRVLADLLKDRHNVGDFGNLALPLARGEVIDEALRLTGIADNADLVADFKKYREIEQQARETQMQLLGLRLQKMPETEIAKPMVITSGDWQFCPPTMFVNGLKCIESTFDNNTTDKLTALINELWEDKMLEDAKQGKGIWANVTNIPDEDEAEDEFLMIEAYGLKCSLTPFVEALKRYNVVGGTNAFLDNDCKRYLLAVVKDEATFAKDNTQTPAKIKNHIKKTLQGFDEMPIYGLFFQMLTLQGLCQWLEGVNINEGDEGYNEAQSLYDWLCEVLATKMMLFCYMPYGTTDLTTLQPLCNYLASTPVGQLVQQYIKERPEQAPEASTEAQGEAKALPKELATDETKKAARRGRPVKPFKDFVKDVGQVDNVMQCLTYCLQGKTGKNAVLIVSAAIKMGLIDRPTYKAFDEAFDVDGVSKECFNRYIPTTKYTQDEITGTQAAITRKMNE